MTCGIPGCSNPAARRVVPGFGRVCAGHAERVRRWGDVRADVPLRPRGPARPKPTCPCGRRCARATDTRCVDCNRRRRDALRHAYDIPVGETRAIDGQVWVNVAQPALWLPRALVVWQAVTGRDLPGGHALVHVDGNRYNDRYENLRVVRHPEGRVVA